MPDIFDELIKWAKEDAKKKDNIKQLKYIEDYEMKKSRKKSPENVSLKEDNKHDET